MRGFVPWVQDRIRRLGHPVVLGLDPMPERFPAALGRAAKRPRGALTSEAALILRFGEELVEATAHRAVAVKVQAACYERFGPAGMAALHHTIAAARRYDLPVIVDVKRGDIARTMQWYGEAYLGPGAGGADAMTVSAYMGRDAVLPLLEACRRGRGLFVLIRTSNPGAADLQTLALADGRTVAEAMAEWLTATANRHMPGEGWSPLGAVVAGNLTSAEEARSLRRRLPRSLILAPGVGRQGGSAATLEPLYDDRRQGLLVPLSSWLTYAFERPAYAHRPPDRYAETCLMALEDAIADLCVGDTHLCHDTDRM